MVTRYRTSIHGLRTHILTALLLASCIALGAQKDHAYIVAVKLHVGGAPIIGFLHSVNDSSVTLIPGAGSRKALKKALEDPHPISIPLSLVKKLSITRVKTFAHGFLSGLVVSLAYSLAYLALVPLEPTLGSLIIYTATVTTATLVTLILIYTRNYKPTEPGFTITMQKYCLVKTGIVADGL